MSRLAELIEKHIESLTAARVKLAGFLSQNFKIEDLLAVQEPITKFDRNHASLRMSDAIRVSYLRFFAGKPIRKIRAPQTTEKAGDAKGPP